MSRTSKRVPRRFSAEDASKGNTNYSSADESSSLSDTEKDSVYPKNTGSPVRNECSDSEEINDTPQNHHRRESTGDTEEFSVEEEAHRPPRKKDHAGRKKYQRDYRKAVERQRGGHDRRKKRNQSRQPMEIENEKEYSTSNSSSENSRSEEDARHPRRKKRNFKEKDELPITEILRRTQENMRSKYEQQASFPQLTTDKVYVQHRGGFSTMKVDRLKNFQKKKNEETVENVKTYENQSSPPIKVAVMVQKFWKSTGLIYQGILGGMALMHVLMLQIFYNASIEFIVQYSAFCEIYTNVFSFLITLCIVTTLDKVDLARLDMEYLRGISIDCNKAIIAVPLYLIIFCLHQICCKTDSQLSLVHYYDSNDTFWENATDVQSLLNDLDSWHRMSISKDLLAVFAWVFVSLGTKDDAFLTYLQSMEKYANDVEFSK